MPSSQSNQRDIFLERFGAKAEKRWCDGEGSHFSLWLDRCCRSFPEVPYAFAYLIYSTGLLCLSCVRDKVKAARIERLSPGLLIRIYT